MKTVSSCVCGSTDIARSYTKQDYDFYVCLRCKHLQIFPVPSSEVLSKVYENGFGAVDRSSDEAAARKLAQEARREFPVQMLQKLGISKESYILDVGCSYGYDLHALKELGYSNVVGMEISVRAVAIANEMLGVNAFSSLEEIEKRGLRFDFVYLKHNLEHHPDPVGTLKAVASLMKPGAHLLVGVPNRKSVNGLWGKRWEWVTPPVHIHFFSRESLKETMRQAGVVPTSLYSQRGHGMPVLKHAVFFSPIVSRIARKTIGSPYDPSTARSPALRAMMEGIFALSAKLTGPFSSWMKSKFIVGEELWALGTTPA